MAHLPTPVRLRRREDHVEIFGRGDCHPGGRRPGNAGIPTKALDGEVVHSITLPYLGSDLTESCDSANLHVFAISTHN